MSGKNYKDYGVMLLWQIVEELVAQIMRIHIPKGKMLESMSGGLPRRDCEIMLNTEYVQIGRVIIRLLVHFETIELPKRDVFFVVKGLERLLAGVVLIIREKGPDNINSDIVWSATRVIQKLTGESLKAIRDRVRKCK